VYFRFHLALAKLHAGKIPMQFTIGTIFPLRLKCNLIAMAPPNFSLALTTSITVRELAVLGKESKRPLPSPSAYPSGRDLPPGDSTAAIENSPSHSLFLAPSAAAIKDDAFHSFSPR